MRTVPDLSTPSTWLSGISAFRLDEKPYWHVMAGSDLHGNDKSAFLIKLLHTDQSRPHQYNHRIKHPISDMLKVTLAGTRDQKCWLFQEVQCNYRRSCLLQSPAGIVEARTYSRKVTSICRFWFSAAELRSHCMLLLRPGATAPDRES